MSSFSSLSQVKTQGGIDQGDTSKDDQIQILLDGLSNVIEQELHRTIPATSYTEFYSGDNSQVLLLRQRPVISVTRVNIDNGGEFGQGVNAFDPTQDLVAGVDYAIMAGQNGIGSNGMLKRINGSWPRRQSYVAGQVSPQYGAGTGNILVMYTAGYSPIPAAITYAVNALVLSKLATAAIGGAAQSMSYEDASVSLFSPEQLTGIIGTIERTIGSFKAFPV